MGSLSRNENEIGLGRVNIHGDVLALNPPHKALYSCGHEQRLRGGTYSKDSVVLAVARQLYQYHKPIVAEEVSWRSARAMRARIDSTNSEDAVCQDGGVEKSMKNSTHHEVSASARCKWLEQCTVAVACRRDVQKYRQAMPRNPFQTEL